MLSGFLIGGLLLKQIEDKKTRLKDFCYFLVRRWFRTLPNYYLILIVNCLLYYVIKDSFNIDVWDYFLFLQNFSSAQPDFFTESWSLSIEEFAYILGPIVLLLLQLVLGKLNKYKFLLATIIIIILISVSRSCFHHYNSIHENINWSSSLRKVVIYRVDSIYYGFLIAYLAKHKPVFWLKYKRIMFFLGALLFIIVHLYIFKAGLTPNVTSLFFNIFYLPLVSISVALLFPIFSNWKNNTILVLKPFTTISILSYSMYLVNYSIVVLTLQYFINAELTIFNKTLLLVTFLLLTIILSYTLYTFFEKPILRLRDSNFIKEIFK